MQALRGTDSAKAWSSVMGIRRGQWVWSRGRGEGARLQPELLFGVRWGTTCDVLIL